MAKDIDFEEVKYQEMKDEYQLKESIQKGIKNNSGLKDVQKEINNYKKKMK